MNQFAKQQAALTDRVLAAVGVSAREAFEVEEPGDGFRHGRVSAFDPAQFAGEGPDDYLSAHALRGPGPGAALPDAVRRFLAPDVPADRGRFVEYALYGYTDGFLPLDDPAGMDFPALRHPPRQIVTQRVASRGLTLELDEDAGCLGAGWPQAKVAFLRGALDRARLRRTVALFVAGAVGVDKAWDGAADPDADVRAELDAQRLRASRVLYDGRAWSQRGRVAREQAAPLPEELARRFAVEAVQVLRADAAACPAGDDGGQVLLFCAADSLGRNDFSNLKTFTAPAANGARYAAYVCRLGAGRWRVGVECHETVALTSTVGLAVISVGQKQNAAR
ncbi:MAG: hypothetical protein INR65_09595 [Gluconacetobacter diazotrophicus]|nr:hypothetical protein [Gluconacetobacter diazotrophicus]